VGVVIFTLLSPLDILNQIHSKNHYGNYSSEDLSQHETIFEKLVYIEIKHGQKLTGLQ